MNKIEIFFYFLIATSLSFCHLYSYEDDVFILTFNPKTGKYTGYACEDKRVNELTEQSMLLEYEVVKYYFKDCFDEEKYVQ